MPTISIDVTSTTTPLIDAQLSISFSRLTDVLKVLVEHSNRHEADIEKLKNQVQVEREKNEVLSAAVQASSGEAIRAEMLEELGKMRAQIAALQKQQEATSQRTRENFETTQKMLQDEASSTSKAFATAAERASQVQNQVNTLRTSLEGRVDQCHDFLQLWGPPDAKKMGALAKQSREAAAAGGGSAAGTAATSDATATGARTGAGSVGTNEAQDACTDFVCSLRPFAKCEESLDGNGSGKGASAADQEALQTANDDLKFLKEQVHALEAKMEPMESLPPRVKALEDSYKLLDATKADTMALQTKADSEKTAQIANRTNQLGEELAALAARLRAWEDANAGGGGGAAGSARRGSAKVPQPPADDGSLRKRVGVLEEAVEGLEARKADKTEIAKIIATLQGMAGAPVIPMANDVSPKRISSAGSASKRSVFLGRTVAVVRDANGLMTPASLAARM